MKPFRKLSEARARRRESGGNRLLEATRRTRTAAQTQSRADRKRRREERIRAAVRKRGGRQAKIENRVRAIRGWVWRHVRPAFVLANRGLAKIAPYVSRGVMEAFRIPLAGIALLLDFTLAGIQSAKRRLGPLLAGVSAFVERTVTPINTAMAVGIGAAIALGAAQFLDYSGIAVGDPLYQGEEANVAPVPLTDVEKLGSAHAYVMLPLAVVAIVLIVLTRRGRWKLGRAVALIGLIGIAVTLLIDRPQALDAGPLADAYAGSEAKLLDGYYAQLIASIALLVMGPALGMQVKRESGSGGGERRRDGVGRRLRRKTKFMGAAHRREASA
jgi:hypothetical protein